MTRKHMPARKPLTFRETIWIALVMLRLGVEGKHYLIFERDLNEWKMFGWLHRN